jgi:hypothetical protein
MEKYAISKLKRELIIGKIIIIHFFNVETDPKVQ